MRIVIAQDALHTAGGVETYLRGVIPALRSRGHSIALLYGERRDPDVRMAGADGPIVGGEAGAESAFTALHQWRPDVCFSQNMAALDIERRMLAAWPVVKMMHGYFGTCVSALKTHAFPGRVACARPLGVACLALYAPRRCGKLTPAAMIRGYRWAQAQHALFDEYAAIVVGSRHMEREFLNNGARRDRLYVAPLFAPSIARTSPRPLSASLDTVLFLGRMTHLKGGDVLIRATALASRRLGRSVRLVMAGEGPQRAEWQQLASELSVAAEFPGWIADDARREALMRASVLAVPSLWPEPFGLSGLEAASAGVPSVAFDVGGIREWLRHRESGLLVEPSGGATAFADALVEVLGDDGLRERLGRGSVATAQRMSVDTHVDAIERVLRMAARVPLHVATEPLAVRL